MEIIKLPAIFNSNDDLTNINQKLRNSNAKLDWSSVISITESHLEILLDGISEDDENLNLHGGIADYILSSIALYFSHRDNKLILKDKNEVKSELLPLETIKKDKSNKKSKKVNNNQTESFLESNYIPSNNPSEKGQLFESEIIIKPSLTNNNQENIDNSIPEKIENNPNKKEKKAILKTASDAQIRQELVEAIYKDLLGPVGGEDEEIDEMSVNDRYLVGMLAPQIRNKKPEFSEEIPLENEPELQDELEIAGADSIEEGNSENTALPVNTMFPSSMGMSFCVKDTVKSIKITAEWGQYERQKGEISLKEDGTPKTIWKRYPRQGSTIIELQDKKEIHWVVCADEAPSVYVTGKIRWQDGWIVTLFLVNAQTEPAKLRDQAWLFQPKLTVTSPLMKDFSINERNSPTYSPFSGDRDKFIKPLNDTELNREEELDIFEKKPLPRNGEHLDAVIHAENMTMAMLYRHQVEFAVGHGVSIHVEKSPHNSQKARLITTSFIPSFEVAPTKPPTIAEIPSLKGLVLDMQTLADTTPENLPTILEPLVNAYSDWINEQETYLHSGKDIQLINEYHHVAERAIASCGQTLNRIKAGIELLKTNTQAVSAFQFMNQAMALQRIHSLYAENKRRQKDITLEELNIPKNRSWYPFQLAFILLNIPSLTDLNHPERINPQEAIADLLWFPTGGGKTEAYLGLTAYTIGIRRLQGIVGNRDGNYGVAVLMRYTLRLLTLQQFQRATTLICACESIRREDQRKWGTEPIRIGLWVGQNSTPNYTSQSEEYIKQMRGNSRYSGGTPHQLTNCPWCGTKIEAGKHIHVDPVDKGQGRTLIKCGDSLGECIFSQGEGLPVLVVDEEIYRRLPTLLIATVDKFAQLPWKGEVQMLFGKVNGYCERHGFRSPDLPDSDRHNKTNKLPSAKTISHLNLRPPDLIIQDELHLISGPLGTLVGLYETAINELCTWEVNGKKVQPKIIASTATIKQAEAQIFNLFVRKLEIFPPQCLDIRDNFFSRQREINQENFGRLYLGICAPGKRLKAALIRVYIAVLASSQYLYEQYGKSVDPWMTLVGYFNSLRELGGTRRLVDDDITTRLKKMERRGLANRILKQVDELTSRKNSTEIPEILDRLETPFDSELEAKNKQKRLSGQRINQPYPLDVILATNMISVGVDVKRLGMMVVCGQPKNTAEYIQATSRVGRSLPGLVITVYNWSRPRDLSHYERFEHYHGTFYQNVEALSVTPFAEGALYRGLSALLISLIRQMGTEFNGNDKAGMIQRDHPYIQSALNLIVQRAEAIDGKEVAETVRRKLEAKLDSWLQRCQNLVGGTTLKYQITSKDGISINLLDIAGKKEWRDFTCLNSLRNVEPTIGLIFSDQPPDDECDRFPQSFVKDA